MRVAQIIPGFVGALLGSATYLALQRRKGKPPRQSRRSRIFMIAVTVALLITAFVALLLRSTPVSVLALCAAALLATTLAFTRLDEG